MSTLIRRHSMSEFDSMFESVNRMMEGLWGQSSAAGLTHMVPMDVFEAENALFVKLALPGLRPEDLDVSIENDVLTLKGEIRQNWPSEAKVYHRENRYGAFTRSIRLPEGLNVEAIDASFDLGVVTVRIPKEEPKRPAVRKIAVRMGGEPVGAPALAESAGEADDREA